LCCVDHARADPLHVSGGDGQLPGHQHSCMQPAIRQAGSPRGQLLLDRAPANSTMQAVE
jgi:hypothetical protein